MNSIASSAVNIQTSPESVPSTPSWLGEVVVVSHYLKSLGLLEKIASEVRFSRKRVGTYDTIDFVCVLIGYALSGEATLKEFYEHLKPLGTTFMSLFGRNELPSRYALSRYLSAIDQPTVEALRTVFEKDLASRPLISQGETVGGLWDRCGNRWIVFDIDATRQAARQRALPRTKDLPSAQRRMDLVCAPGYTGRKRGEVVRTRTTVLQAHTHQWFGTFGGSGNGEYRGELRRAIEAIVPYLRSQQLPLDHVVVRLDGQYGDCAIVVDLDRYRLSYVMRGKDYHLLDLPALQARLAQPPDQVVTHPETGTTRALFDCPDVLVDPAGPRLRVIIATQPEAATAARVGSTRDGVVYELLFTNFPQSAFTPADVLDQYLHRGSFETVLSDEDKEQDPDRWVSHTPSGQEFWQILAQWMWNLRLEMGHRLHPTPMRTTEFAPAQTEPLSAPLPPAPPPVAYGPPEWAKTVRKGIFAGADFRVQPDGTLLCPADHPLYAREHRKEDNGIVRVVYSARVAHCRTCLLREQCLGHGKETKDPRRVSATRRPIEGPVPPPEVVPSLPPATRPILWGDWSRCQTRRSFTSLLRTQTVMITVPPVASESSDVPDRGPITREERVHCRLSWAQRLARNACRVPTQKTLIHLFGIPTPFAESVGLAVA
jgi:hypothetical protein